MAAQDLQNTLITVNVALSGIPVSEAGFGTVMFVSPDAAPGARSGLHDPLEDPGFS